jgi:hypothetical protein
LGNPKDIEFAFSSSSQPLTHACGIHGGWRRCRLSIRQL